MAISERLRQEYAREVQLTDCLLSRGEGVALDWRPHDRSRTLGELAAHIADIPTWGLHILDGLKLDAAALPPEEPAKRLDEICRRFRRHADATLRLLDKSDAEWQAVWWLKRDHDALYSMPRTTAFRRFVLNHLVHHRGQLSVYIRMNDVAVPGIYGDTADDAWTDYALSTITTISPAGAGGG